MYLPATSRVFLSSVDGWKHPWWLVGSFPQGKYETWQDRMAESSTSIGSISLSRLIIRLDNAQCTCCMEQKGVSK